MATNNELNNDKKGYANNPNGNEQKSESEDFNTAAPEEENETDRTEKHTSTYNESGGGTTTHISHIDGPSNVPSGEPGGR